MRGHTTARTLTIVLYLITCLLLAAGTADAALERSKPVSLTQPAVTQPRTGEPVDAAPFGEFRTWEDGKDVGILWEDARDVCRVVVRFADASAVPDPKTVKLQYWLTGGWPGHRVPRSKEDAAHISGWFGMGDWYNGEWQSADARLSTDGAAWTYTFGPANAKEFPSVKDFDGTYRTTFKLRLLFSDRAPQIASMQAFTDSVWEKTSAVVLWKDSRPWNGRVEGFNAYPGEIRPVDGGITFDIWYAKPAAAVSGDEPVITLRAEKGFSFSPTEIAEGRRVFVPDLGALVKLAGDQTSYVEAEDALAKAEKNRYDAVAELPEQTLERAWSDMPRKGRIYMPLAVEGGRQHFVVHPTGDVAISQSWQGRVKGRDTDRCKWNGEYLDIRFGFPHEGTTGASIEDGVLPIPLTWYENGGIRYAEQAFATTLAGKLAAGGRIPADDSQVLMVRYRLTNLTEKPLQAKLPITTMDSGGDEQLTLHDGLVFGRHGDQDALRFYIDPGPAHMAVHGKAVLCVVDLPARSSKDVYLAVPFETLDKPEEFAALRALDYDRQHSMIAGYWRKRLAQSARMVTPEPMINQFLAANPSHQLINTENEVGTDDRAMAKVGTVHYGVYTNESVMMLTDLDRRGYHDVARKGYESWIHYQGSVGLPGDYSTSDGVFYGARGYESGGYNQHHGWALWGMGEHYWFTRDNAWLDHAAPAIIKACDWIIHERSRTKTDECTGIRAIERGLLPPGSLEDIGDWRCWMSNNVMSYWGMHNAAAALAARGNPEGERLLKEAAAYREDIRTAFFEAMLRSPVARLRDGSYVPIIPSDVHRRGRSIGWITEVLEGSIHMIRCGIIDPHDPIAAWIMKDYEDNRYLTPPYGYGIPNEDKLWFSLGGFCQQPSLLCSPTPYIMRDDPKHYIRAYFNAFSAGYFAERAMITEHPLPNLGDYAGDHFKSSDEAMNSSWVRWMFIWDEGEDLYLGKTIPRYWLRDGQEVKLEHAATHFGPMSVSIRSLASTGRIEMTIDPPTRNSPRAIYARFRHPDGMSMNRVTVNGKPWKEFDAKKEWVVLPALKGKTVVTAYYE